MLHHRRASTRRSFAALAALLLTLLAAGCGAEARVRSQGPSSTGPGTTTTTTAPPTTEPADDLPRRIDVPGTDAPGALLDPAEGGEPYEADHYEGATEADVAEFEAGFPAAARTSGARQADEVLAQLDDYGRQYVRVVGGEQPKVLQVQAACTGLGDDEDDKAPLHWYGVADGGSCFWTATWDLDRHRLVWLSVNGYG